MKNYYNYCYEKLKGTDEFEFFFVVDNIILCNYLQQIL